VPKGVPTAAGAATGEASSSPPTRTSARWPTSASIPSSGQDGAPARAGPPGQTRRRSPSRRPRGHGHPGEGRRGRPLRPHRPRPVGRRGPRRKAAEQRFLRHVDPPPPGNGSPGGRARRRSSSSSSSSSPTSAWSASPTPGNQRSSRASRRPSLIAEYPFTTLAPNLASSTSASTARSWSPTSRPYRGRAPRQGLGIRFPATSSGRGSSSHRRRFAVHGTGPARRLPDRHEGARGLLARGRVRPRCWRPTRSTPGPGTVPARPPQTHGGRKDPFLRHIGPYPEGVKPWSTPWPGRSNGSAKRTEKEPREETIGLFGGTFDPSISGSAGRCGGPPTGRARPRLFIPPISRRTRPPGRRLGGRPLPHGRAGLPRRPGFEASAIEVEARRNLPS